MTYTLTTDQVISTIERLLADENYGPEHVAACTYGTVDKPVCIVGHIFAEHIPDIFDQAFVQADEGIWGIIRDGEIKTDTLRMRNALVDLQGYQDAYCPWGEAVENSNVMGLKEAA